MQVFVFSVCLSCSVLVSIKNNSNTKGLLLSYECFEFEGECVKFCSYSSGWQQPSLVFNHGVMAFCICYSFIKNPLAANF